MNSTAPVATWLDSLPADWKTDRLKDVVPRIVGGGTPSSSNPDFWDGDIIWVTPTDLSSGKGNDEIFDSQRRISNAGLEASAAVLLPRGAVIMASRATIGAVRIAGRELTTNQGFISFVCDDQTLNHRFLYYAIAGFLGQYFSEIAPGTTFNEISRGDVRQETIGFPQLLEQKRIAKYLDATSASIQTGIAIKRRQLEALSLLRKSTIHRAVTKGLNPDVEMHRTDVEWIPAIPAHWRVRRVKDVLDFHDHTRIPISAAERGLMTEKTFDYYGASGVIDKVDDYLFDGTYILLGEDGANLLTRSKPLAFLASGKFWVNNHAHILKPKGGGNDVFFAHLLESHDYSPAVTGSAQPKLTMENLGRFKVAVPPREEQEDIAAFILQKDADFRSLRSRIQQQVAVLDGYRKSLIHECATGQRRITEAEVKRVA